MQEHAFTVAFLFLCFYALVCALSLCAAVAIGAWPVPIVKFHSE